MKKIILLLLFVTGVINIQAQSKYYGGKGAGYSSGSNTFSAALPLSLLSFDLQLAPGGVNVIWKTSSERNLISYEIERSIDGKHFIAVAEVMAAGESQSLIKYTHEDAVQWSGYIYYRLTSKDMDGKTQSLGIKRLHAHGVEHLSFQSVPNPANQVVSFVSQGSKSTEENQLVIVDMQGKIFYQGVYMMNQPIDLTMFPDGIYIAKIIGEIETTEKFIVAH